ncbi:unnamed protein product, partial [Coccothraustes coccothraustes]
TPTGTAQGGAGAAPEQPVLTATSPARNPLAWKGSSTPSTAPHENPRATGMGNFCLSPLGMSCFPCKAGTMMCPRILLLEL